MTEPVVTVEIEFTAGVWTDVSAYFRGATTKRGKQRSLDKVAAGSMVATFSNADRRFDPEHATSPHAGSLLPGKRIRLRATWNAVTYPVFTGFVERIIQGYNPPNDAVAVFDCVDGLGKLAAAGLGSPFEVTMAAEPVQPNIWYRLGERGGPYAFDRSGNNRHGLYVDHSTFPHLLGVIGYGAGSLLQHDNDAGVSFPKLLPTWVHTPPMAGGVTNPLPWSIEFWFAGELEATGAGDVTYMVMPADGVLTTNGSLRVYGEHGYLDVDGVTKLNQRLVVSQRDTTSAIVMAPSGLFDGLPHHVVVVGESGQPIRLYVDDAAQTLNQSGTAIALRDVGFAIGNIYGGKGQLTIDEFLAWNDARDATERARISHAAAGWAGDTGPDRITRVLDAVGWPAADRSITAQFGGVLAGTGLAVSAVEHLQDLESTIEGRLWIKANGTLTLLGRNEHLVAPYTTSQGTFGDGPGELGYTGLGDSQLDWGVLTNVVRRTNGESVIEAADAASIATYGKRDRTGAAEVESLFLTLAQEYDLAAFRVAHFAQPVAHVSGLTVNPRSDPVGLWPQVLGRELADRITLKRHPQGVGAVISKETIIEGVSHTIAPKKWSTTFTIDAIAAQRYFLFDSTVWASPDWRFAA